MAARILPLLLLQTILYACAAPSYYFQAASGHLELMRQREDISDLIADSTTDPELAGRLELAQEVRVFGVEQLGLPDGGGYRQYAATGREAVTWNVVAAPEFSLEPRTWCFLVAGCVPYRGYFEHEAARQYAQKLDKNGYDVIVAPAVAYSTLGWFEDPLLDTMFRHGEAQFAGTVFHEMAHQAVYVKGDAAFNESFAGFVEEAGLELWLESRGEATRWAEWQAARTSSRTINELFANYRGEFEILYASELPENTMRGRKQELLSGMCADFHDLLARGDSDSCTINNASFSLQTTYHGGLCAFENLFRETGGDMTLFLERAQEQAKRSDAERRAWLDQPCNPVARESKL